MIRFVSLGFQRLAVGHIHENPFAGFVDAEFFALLVDMGDHQMGMLDRIRFEIPHAAVYVSPVLWSGNRGRPVRRRSEKSFQRPCKCRMQQHTGRY